MSSEEHITATARDAQPPVERFKAAVQRGDAPTLRRLLEQHAEVRAAVNEPIFSFDAPALVAMGDHPDVADVLLEFGGDPNRGSDWWAGSFHPLHGASARTAERLLAAGAIPDACAAAHLDRPDLLARLLAEDPARVHARGGDGQTPLHFARSRVVADMLLAAGADIDARDVDHRATPAEWMLSDFENPTRSRVELARYLVDRGASADIFLASALGLTERALAMVAADPAVLRLRTAQGEYAERAPSSYHIYLWAIGANMTPLETAARFRQADTLAALMRVASPEQRLLFACHEGDEREARAIVRDHPGIVGGLGEADRRALTDEAWAANGPAVALMLALGFDPAIPAVAGPTGGTALHCAAWEGSVDCVRSLLEYPSGRALINARENTYNGTPLGWCCHGSRNCGNPRADHAAVAGLLLAAGAERGPEMTGCSEAVQAVLDAGPAT